MHDSPSSIQALSEVVLEVWNRSMLQNLFSRHPMVQKLLIISFRELPTADTSAEKLTPLANAAEPRRRTDSNGSPRIRQGAKPKRNRVGASTRDEQLGVMERPNGAQQHSTEEHTGLNTLLVGYSSVTHVNAKAMLTLCYRSYYSAN